MWNPTRPTPFAATWSRTGSARHGWNSAGETSLGMSRAVGRRRTIREDRAGVQEIRSAAVVLAQRAPRSALSGTVLRCSTRCSGKERGPHDPHRSGRDLPPGRRPERIMWLDRLLGRRSPLHEDRERRLRRAFLSRSPRIYRLATLMPLHSSTSPSIPHGVRPTPRHRIWQTLAGRLDYVGAIAPGATGAGYRGAEDAGFDLEVWNELTFGSPFPLHQQLLRKTADRRRTPAMGSSTQRWIT